MTLLPASCPCAADTMLKRGRIHPAPYVRDPMEWRGGHPCNPGIGTQCQSVARAGKVAAVATAELQHRLNKPCSHHVLYQYCEHGRGVRRATIVVATPPLTHDTGTVRTTLVCLCMLK